MESYKYLLDIALILISTKILGLLTRRIQLPQVVGALIAGLLLGPACFGVLQETDFMVLTKDIENVVRDHQYIICILIRAPDPEKACRPPGSHSSL